MEMKDTDDDDDYYYYYYSDDDIKKTPSTKTQTLIIYIVK